MGIGFYIIIVVSVALGALGMFLFNKNEEEVVDIQRKIQEFKNNEQEVPDLLMGDLKKATNKSINFKKLQYVGFTIAICVVVLTIIKLTFGI